MTECSHKHSESHRHVREDEPSGMKFHKDWRVWLAVVVMLAPIIIYVLTLDDSIAPIIMRQ